MKSLSEELQGFIQRATMAGALTEHTYEGFFPRMVKRALALEAALADAEKLLDAIKADLYAEGRDIVFRYEGWECDYHDMADEAIHFMKCVKRLLEATTKENHDADPRS